MLTIAKRSHYNVYFKFFLRIVPEKTVIDVSSLCKFRKLRLKSMNMLDLPIN